MRRFESCLPSHFPISASGSSFRTNFVFGIRPSVEFECCDNWLVRVPLRWPSGCSERASEVTPIWWRHERSWYRPHEEVHHGKNTCALSAPVPSRGSPAGAARMVNPDVDLPVLHGQLHPGHVPGALQAKDQPVQLGVSHPATLARTPCDFKPTRLPEEPLFEGLDHYTCCGREPLATIVIPFVRGWLKEPLSEVAEPIT